MQINTINQIKFNNINSFINKEKTTNNTVDKSHLMINFLSATSNYNVAFCGTKTPIYAVDENGNYQRFESRREAADAINTDAPSITQCISGKRSKAGGHYFLLATDVEITDGNGNKIVDKEKIKTKIEEINAKRNPDKSKKAIYSVDKDGNYTKYPSLTEAAIQLGGSNSNISKCLKGQQNTCCGVGFLYADEVEVLDENNEVKINKRKIKAKSKEVAKALSEHPEIRPFYAVDKEGKYIKFERNRDATKALGVHHSAIKCCLEGERSTTGGYAFVYASEVEEFDENGNLTVKIDIPAETYDQRTPIPIYTINRHGRVRRYSSMGEAATKLSIPRRNIDSCINNERETAHGFAFIKAEEVESVDTFGRRTFDRRKINEKFKQVIKNAVYVVDKDENYKRYDNATEAAKALDVTEPMILFCANGVQKGVKGHTIVRATYVESFEGDKVVYNLDLLKKFAREAKNLQDKPIVAIDKNKNKRTYKNRANAAKSLGIRSDKITKCLNGQQKTSGGYRFVYEETLNRKRYKVDHIIYALDRAGEVHEFKNIDEAAKTLKIDKEEIITFLRKGRTSDKKDTLNGFVFATAEDA